MGVLDENNQTEVVCVSEGRMRIPEHGRRDAAHLLIEGFINRQGELGASRDIPLSISTQWPALALDLAHLLASVAGVSIEYRGVDARIPQSLQIAHMVLIGIGDEQVVEPVPAKVFCNIGTGAPVVC